MFTACDSWDKCHCLHTWQSVRGHIYIVTYQAIVYFSNPIWILNLKIFSKTRKNFFCSTIAHSNKLWCLIIKIMVLLSCWYSNWLSCQLSDFFVNCWFFLPLYHLKDSNQSMWLDSFCCYFWGTLGSFQQEFGWWCFVKCWNSFMFNYINNLNAVTLIKTH